ncbi:MAG TPA: hypothetical protein VFB95_09530 [Candidatus Cryosericum sp.]|nr:hypothetical protein [Candidatus Cryosericum sp.]
MASRNWTIIAVLVAPLLLSCNSDDDESKILPIRAVATVDTVPDDPAIFLAVSPLDTKTDDSIVSIDVMVRMTAAQEFDAVSLQVRFDPGIVQFAGFIQSPENDGVTFNPFGECNSGMTYCDKHPFIPPPTPPAPTTGPLCQSNGTSQPGNAFIGMAARPPPSLCDSFNRSGTFKLLTLNFIASSVGSTRIELVSSPQTGDCEILNNLVELAGPVPCIDGMATITASR